ncbi:MAG TPA: RagB/SusD family nutrient uptake outer membrane protein, partial [Flavisolibacter sp.]
KAEVYQAIEKDLTDAAAILPQAYPASDLGRVTKGAAIALKAKVIMYQSKPGEASRWNEVLDLTNQVIGMGYNLFPNYEAQFRIPNEFNVESVFEINARYVPGDCGASNSQYSQVQGVRGSTGGGWGFNVPTANLASSYEAGDPRRDATIIFRGEITPQGDAIPAVGDNPMYNQKSYVPFSMYVECSEGAEQNIRVIRFAEVLLMNAEAANEMNNPTQAKLSLNKVRERARGGNPAILPDITTNDKDALRLAIWNERRAELAMERDRYFDVIRQGRAATVFGPLGWQPRNVVWPIPQKEIDLSAGVLIQNAGY